MFTNCLSGIKVSENKIKILSNSENSRYQNNENLKNGRFSVKVEKGGNIMLYGPPISQSDCRKACPYQLSYNYEAYNHKASSYR